MNVYQKVYKREKLFGNIFFSLLYNLRAFIIIFLVLFIFVAVFAGFGFIVEYFMDVIILSALVLVGLFIVFMLVKPGESVDDRFRRIHEELGTTPESLNAILEKMTCINDNIFISGKYYINFRTGKATQVDRITALRKASRYSRNTQHHEIIIDTAYCPSFDSMVYNTRKKRDDVYATLSIITGIKEDPRSSAFMKGFFR